MISLCYDTLQLQLVLWIMLNIRKISVVHLIHQVTTSFNIKTDSSTFYNTVIKLKVILLKTRILSIDIYYIFGYPTINVENKEI